MNPIMRLVPVICLLAVAVEARSQNETPEAEVVVDKARKCAFLAYFAGMDEEGNHIDQWAKAEAERQQQAGEQDTGALPDLQRANQGAMAVLELVRGTEKHIKERMVLENGAHLDGTLEIMSEDFETRKAVIAHEKFGQTAATMFSESECAAFL